MSTVEILLAFAPFVFVLALCVPVIVAMAWAAWLSGPDRDDWFTKDKSK